MDKILKRPNEAWYRARILENLDIEEPMAGAAVALAEPVAAEEEAEDTTPFAAFLQLQRRAHGLTIVQLASRIDVPMEDILQAETEPGYIPRPRTLQRVAQFADVPVVALARLSGAVAEDPSGLGERALRFAAHSRGVLELSSDEQAILNEFVRFLHNVGDRA